MILLYTDPKFVTYSSKMGDNCYGLLSEMGSAVDCTVIVDSLFKVEDMKPKFVSIESEPISDIYELDDYNCDCWGRVCL